MEMNPKYSVYIPTKNRWKSRLTVKTLESLGVPYHVVIEPQEHEIYERLVGKEKILTLPWSKPASSTELVRVRNWIKDYSTSIGEKRHWQMDDNINAFYRYNNNLKYKVASGTILRAAEDFTDRYDNVALSGLQYAFFATSCRKRLPFILNTRIYSCTLVLNSLPYGWRGIYNDDTDLSIRVLKDGWCTILFNAFLQGKAATMTVKGGNTDIYQEDGRQRMAESLANQHPELVSVTDKKFGRYQHQVDFKLFRKNKLIKKEGLVVPNGVNNYGMVLKQGGVKWNKILK